MEQGHPLPSCHSLSAGLEQFGQELVRPLTLSFKVSPVAEGYGLHLDQFGLQRLNFLV
jgi:hypothetical protein